MNLSGRHICNKALPGKIGTPASERFPFSFIVNSENHVPWRSYCQSRRINVFLLRTYYALMVGFPVATIHVEYCPANRKRGATRKDKRRIHIGDRKRLMLFSNFGINCHSGQLLFFAGFRIQRVISVITVPTHLFKVTWMYCNEKEPSLYICTYFKKI